MKRTIYLMITMLLAMPLAGSKASAQSVMRHRDLQYSMGIHIQDRSNFKRKRFQKQRQLVISREGNHLSTAKMWMLTNELDLSEAQATKLFPRMKEHQKKLDNLSKKHKELFKAFDKKVDDEKASVKDIERFADDVAKLEKERIDLKTSFIKSTKDILKPDQQAVFAIFEERSRGRLRDRLIDSKVMIEMMPGNMLWHIDEDDDDDKDDGDD